MTVVGRVLSAGLATVQDGGRRGYAAVGVPVSGAWHRQRYLLASSLLGPAEVDRRPAVEILDGTFSMSVEAVAVVAVVGPARLTVGGHRAATGTALAVDPGVQVTVGADGPGPTYLVISGWRPPATLGSVATDTFSRLGGRPLMLGDVLVGTEEPEAFARVGAFHRLIEDASGPFRLIPTGVCAMDDIVTARWAVESTARSGVRLRGGSVVALSSTPSAPMIPGAVQVTPSGEAIILGPDGGLTGGYPVAGVIATVDRDRMSLLAPGDAVTFAEIDPVAAAGLRAEQRRRLATSLAHPAALH